MSEKETPHILAAIRLFRDLRGWSYQQARDYAIEEYRRKGWHIPPSIEAMYGHGSPPPAPAKAMRVSPPARTGAVCENGHKRNS